MKIRDTIAMGIGRVAVSYDVALILRYGPLAWLNYLLLPVRIVLVIPTLYPIFALLAALGCSMSLSIELKVLVLSELAPCLFIFWWHRSRRRQPGIGTDTRVV